MYLPNTAEIQPRISAAVNSVAAEFASDVKRINYEIGQDWSGEWAIFFRVLLFDDASSRNRLRTVATSVIRRMSDQLVSQNVDLFPYVDFRSESEQTQVKEPAWA